MEVFTAVPKDARASIRREYRSFLHARDGEVDLEKRTLSRREKDMGRFLIRGRREIDHDLFESQYIRFDPKKKTSNEELLLLSLVKVNAAESYGVAQTIEPALAAAASGADDTELVLLVEEFYHTKILLSAACLYGLEVGAAAEPHVGLRALVASIASLPQTLARPLTLAGEIMGVLTFLELLDVARRVLAHAPEVRDAVEERLCEILIDELGHVSFQRLCMGPIGLLQAKALLPMVAFGLKGAIPEVSALGARFSSPLARIDALAADDLPETVRKRAFIVH